MSGEICGAGEPLGTDLKQIKGADFRTTLTSGTVCEYLLLTTNYGGDWHNIRGFSFWLLRTGERHLYDGLPACFIKRCS
ncbi:hypothetical protein CEXT_31131 [Caerostris extrusa]|uniref:Uncharacterized protein n=1 Tax=Caerostris extrusa TaxID=172846 RepID=A0AAV4XGQ5_CAEEX|nr:hypothetical protein CEXT_31131 [Caerostris extrusa]